MANHKTSGGPWVTPSSVPLRAEPQCGLSLFYMFLHVPTCFEMFLHIPGSFYMTLHVLGSFYISLHVLGKKVVA